MKRDKNIQSLGNALTSMYDQYKIDEQYKRAQLIQSWPELVGEVIATRTGKIFIKEKILYLEILSASLKAELVMSKKGLLERLEEGIGPLPVSDIKFI